MKNRRILNIAIVILLVAALCFSTVAFAAEPAHEKVDNAKTAVVRVAAEYNVYGIKLIGTGTAFGVGDLDSEPEYFVTNAHVIWDEDIEEFAEKVYILLENNAISVNDYEQKVLTATDGSKVEMWVPKYEINPTKTIECSIVNKKDVSLYPDVAILKAEKPVQGRSCLALYDTSESVSNTQAVYAIGYPQTVDTLNNTEERPDTVSYSGALNDVVITDGIVSMKSMSKQFQDTNVIVHTAAINHGNSGGPLVDENGYVVGINTYGVSDDNNLNASVYIDYAIKLLDDAKIDYVKTSEIDEEGFFTTRNIILCALIAAIVAAAAIMILHFKKKSKEYVDPADQLPRIQGLSGYFEGRRFPIDNQVIIGRAPSCNIVFPTDTQGVSSKHCVITNNNGQLYIKDLESSYGTFLNGKTKLEPNKFVTINIGDRIALGSENQSFIITRKGGVL